MRKEKVFQILMIFGSLIACSLFFKRRGLGLGLEAENNTFKKRGFTLIELLVSITLLAMLMMMAYAPYSHYQKKAKLKLASREISQSFYEARNMAISGIKELKSSDIYESENKSI
jgi:prepilin-type N-terminal cleavage/methylation domain-containing protein